MTYIRNIVIGLVILILPGCFVQRSELMRIVDSQYALTGKRFKTKMDLVVFHPLKEKTYFICEFGFDSNIPTREEMKPPYPFQYHEIMILGILPENSEFQIDNVQVGGNSAGTWAIYQGKISKSLNPQWLEMLVECDCLQEVKDGVLQLNSKYLGEIPASQ